MGPGGIHLRRFFLDDAISDDRLRAVLAECWGMACEDVTVIDTVEDLARLPDGRLAILRFHHPGSPFPVSVEIYPRGPAERPFPYRGMEDFAVRLAKALPARVLTDDDATLDPFCGLLFGQDGRIAEVDMQPDEATGADIVHARHRRYRPSSDDPGPP
ncbi:MAG: hypothetical protein H6842_08970 [Rhodospirillaceae bacterium]|nr:hypothetical protein [Rhodospirillaceae bacterium]